MSCHFWMPGPFAACKRIFDYRNQMFQSDNPAVAAIEDWYDDAFHREHGPEDAPHRLGESGRAAYLAAWSSTPIAKTDGCPGWSP
jgi:hypothetical protein